MVPLILRNATIPVRVYELDRNVLVQGRASSNHNFVETKVIIEGRDRPIGADVNVNLRCV